MVSTIHTFVSKESSVMLNRLCEIAAQLSTNRINEGFMTANLDDLDEIIPLDIVAKKFGVHKATVTRWIKQGKLLSVRVGHSLRVRKLDLIAYLNRDNNNGIQ